MSATRQNSQSIEWHKVTELDELAESRVKTVTAGVKSICLVHH